MTPEEEAKNLIDMIADNCCKVCACASGSKIWCACHRKQITEALKLAEQRGRDEQPKCNCDKCIASEIRKEAEG